MSKTTHRRGAAKVEYIAIAVLIALVAIPAISRFSDVLQNKNADAQVEVRLIATEAR